MKLELVLPFWDAQNVSFGHLSFDAASQRRHLKPSDGGSSTEICWWLITTSWVWMMRRFRQRRRRRRRRRRHRRLKLRRSMQFLLLLRTPFWNEKRRYCIFFELNQILAADAILLLLHFQEKEQKQSSAISTSQSILPRTIFIWACFKSKGKVTFVSATFLRVCWHQKKEPAFL